MILFKKEWAVNPCDYASIVKALAETYMDAATAGSLKRKFDVAYMIAKGKMAFTKMKPLCKLELHTVDLGSGYKNNQACATFMEFITLEQKERLQAAFREVKVFCLQANASTGAGNVEAQFLFRC